MYSLIVNEHLIFLNLVKLSAINLYLCEFNKHFNGRKIPIMCFKLTITKIKYYNFRICVLMGEITLRINIITKANV